MKEWIESIIIMGTLINISIFIVSLNLLKCYKNWEKKKQEDE